MSPPNEGKEIFLGNKEEEVSLLSTPLHPTPPHPPPAFVCSLLRVNTEPQIRTLYNYLLRTWEERGTPRGTRAGPRAQGWRRFRRGFPAGRGKGDKEEEAPRTGLAIAAETYPPRLLPFTGAPRAPSPARALPPLPPLYGSGN